MAAKFKIFSGGNDQEMEEKMNKWSNENEIKGSEIHSVIMTQSHSANPGMGGSVMARSALVVLNGR